MTLLSISHYKLNAGITRFYKPFFQIGFDVHVGCIGDSKIKMPFSTRIILGRIGFSLWIAGQNEA
jgi:hypothetical protein